MNKELWHKIETFQFDNWADEYGFVLRLSKENLWTKNFTELAILEYKKFMYLAATANQMVSPSEIVDIVWHQHLIFTQSYNQFCTLLGKNIQHIPSTHNRADFETFKQAKAITTTLYNEVFGEQPSSIWENRTMYDGLKLKKAKREHKTTLIIAFFVFIALTPIAFFILRPLYVNISSVAFLFTLVFAFIGLAILMNRYNSFKIKELITDNNHSSFLFDLHPYEVLYLKNGGVKEGVIGTFHELIEQGNLKVGKDKTIELIHDKIINSREQAIVLKGLQETEDREYITLLNTFETKTIFSNQKLIMDALFNYIRNSDKVSKLLSINLIVLGVFTLLAFMRIVIGISRDKPITFIFFLTIIIVLTFISVLYKITGSTIEKSILNYYTTKIIPHKAKEDNWQWAYVADGPKVLGAALTSLVILSMAHSPSYFSDSSYSCGSNSSCSSDSGSSCGSSCGGCGGGGD
ncbi:MAG: DUF1399 domain-containing protein [Flavobacteriaceae bacterium]|jgi:hypothetical protein|nr:DUF1399 domain-containing protein [Flavobacteriaceae bacterium]